MESDGARRRRAACPRAGDAMSPWRTRLPRRSRGWWARQEIAIRTSPGYSQLRKATSGAPWRDPGEPRPARPRFTHGAFGQTRAEDAGGLSKPPDLGTRQVQRAVTLRSRIVDLVSRSNADSAEPAEIRSSAAATNGCASGTFCAANCMRRGTSGRSGVVLSEQAPRACARKCGGSNER